MGSGELYTSCEGVKSLSQTNGKSGPYNEKLKEQAWPIDVFRFLEF